MKTALKIISNKGAGIAGRMVIHIYRFYMAMGPIRKMYAEMERKMPVKREVILLKRTQSAVSFHLN